ncbi:MAG: CPBP family intramembrane glutamic endopeptidase [Ginsengibacter sp.]
MNLPSKNETLTKSIIGIAGILLLLFCLSRIGSTSFLNLLGLQKINETIYFVSRLLNWACLLLLFLYARKIEKEDLLIWKEKKYQFLSYFISIIGIFIVLIVGGFIIQTLLSLTGYNDKSARLFEIVALMKNNKPLLIFTALTAGIVEELIFRGYMLPRLVNIFKSPFLGIAVSSILFGLLHYKYGTIFNVAGPIFIGAVFATYYWKYRNIKVLIFCHFLWDLVSLFLLLKGH